jgi:hypothetical protein
VQLGNERGGNLGTRGEGRNEGRLENEGRRPGNEGTQYGKTREIAFSCNMQLINI